MSKGVRDRSMESMLKACAANRDTPASMLKVKALLEAPYLLAPWWRLLWWARASSSLTEISAEPAPWKGQIVKSCTFSHFFWATLLCVILSSLNCLGSGLEKWLSSQESLTALAGDLGSVPSTHMEWLTNICITNSLSEGLDTSGPWRYLNSSAHTYPQADTHLHINEKQNVYHPRLASGPFVPCLSSSSHLSQTPRSIQSPPQRGRFQNMSKCHWRQSTALSAFQSH